MFTAGGGEAAGEYDAIKLCEAEPSEGKDFVCVLAVGILAAGVSFVRAVPDAARKVSPALVAVTGFSHAPT